MVLESLISLTILFVILWLICADNTDVAIGILVVLLVFSGFQFVPKIKEVRVDGCTYWVKDVEVGEEPKSVKLHCDEEKE